MRKDPSRIEASKIGKNTTSSKKMLWLGKTSHMLVYCAQSTRKKNCQGGQKCQWGGTQPPIPPYWTALR